MTAELDRLRDWIGRSESRTDTITAVPVAAMSNTLDRDDPAPRPGDPLPELWHWLYFLPMYRHSEAGPDGHPARGGFMPPVPLPRRMFAGSRLTWQRPLRVGEQVTRVSRITDVTPKTGRSGTLVFVKVVHESSGADGPAMVEEQDIVYRDAPNPADPPPPPTVAPVDSAWSREIRPDPLLLFRYSALTFNGHRIHYDRPYAMGEEGYPGLVVHGPLIATLLLDVLRRNLPDARVAGYRFRAMKPLFDTAPFRVCGRPEADGTVKLWAADAGGALCMDATATLA
ncbi:MAG TPA: MaoC family dehydratase N-terminal domain-containing protein [Quisquiliibacterium sp.]|nr:MaoC family dehydratase N-terminal domain-containing protein [Quisquiliibacterium sp.]